MFLETTIRQLLEAQPSTDQVTSDQVTISGWVRTHRRSKNVSFIEVADGTCVKGLQLVVQPNCPSYTRCADQITTGASIEAKGTLVASPAKGQAWEVHVETISVVGEAHPEHYPLQKKGHSLEFLREQMHLRPRSNTIGAVMRIRSTASWAIHQFFQERGFYYVHTPIITTSDCEGAGEMFHVSNRGHQKPALAPAPEGNRTEESGEFFGEPASLTVSGQLEAEIYALALRNVYTFGPTFRAENSNTARHLAEFWMIEPEMTFCDLEGDRILAQEFIQSVLKTILSTCAEELEFLHSREWSSPEHLAALHHVSQAPFQVIDYSDAIAILEKSGRSFEYPVFWGADLQSEHERFITDEYCKGPVVVINYPREIKAFYMRLNDDEKTVAAMDILVPRLGEIVGGSQREERLDVLERRIIESNLNLENYWWYRDLRRFGSVPHAGFGLGLERLLMYVTGMHNIRDVIPFPRFPGFAKF